MAAEPMSPLETAMSKQSRPHSAQIPITHCQVYEIRFEVLKNSATMNRIQSHFVNAVAVLLFCAAAINLLSASSSVPVLNQPDVLLQLNDRLALNSRLVLILKGILELSFSGYLLAGKESWHKLLWVAWLATNLLIYRIGSWWSGAPVFSDCAGNLIDWFTVSPRWLGALSNILLTLMFVGSSGLLLIGWLKELKASKKETVVNVSRQPV
jgi:hypothetical protein